MGRWFYFAVYIFLKGYVFINFIYFINSGSKVYEVDKTYAHQNYMTNHIPRRNSPIFFLSVLLFLSEYKTLDILDLLEDFHDIQQIQLFTPQQPST